MHHLRGVGTACPFAGPSVQLAEVDVDVHVNPAVRHSLQLQQAGAVDSASERIA
jgi:hypothetical protein